MNCSGLINSMFQYCKGNGDRALSDGFQVYPIFSQIESMISISLLASGLITL
jgi:hypothetical protein